MKRSSGKSQQPSQRSTHSAAGVWFISIVAIAWNGPVWTLLMPSGSAPFIFKLMFGLIGLLVAWLAVAMLRLRWTGCWGTLELSRDPVPHGVPIEATFRLSKPLSATAWSMQAVIESSEKGRQGLHQVWEGTYPLLPSTDSSGAQMLKGRFVLPGDLPSTLEPKRWVSLVLHADQRSWSFGLSTRPATDSERAAHDPFDVPVTVTAQPVVPEDSGVALSRNRRRRTVMWGLYGFMLCLVAWQVWQMVDPAFADAPLVHRAEAKVASLGLTEARLNTRVDTTPFPITVTNWLINDWKYRAHLEATAQVLQGELHVRVHRLSVMPVTQCEGAEDCRLQGVNLLLALEGEESFSTLAQGELMPWAVDLGAERRVERSDGYWVLKLPKNLPSNGIKLKLQVVSQRKNPRTGLEESTWVYPSHGSQLALQRALALADQNNGGREADPCERVDDVMAAVQVGCNERLAGLLANSQRFSISGLWHWLRATAQGQKKPDLDAMLVAAVTHYNREAVPLLLNAGASANAVDPDYPDYSVLGLAASGNQQESVLALLRAGADVHRHVLSENGVSIMPLTQALRRDPPEAVALLLDAGAPLDNQDPQGWTVMHIAAYEGASRSIPVLVQAGGDVNETTPLYRRQTAFHTAVKSAPKHTIEVMLAAGASLTITDAQGENACGWARFFKRSPDIERLVCVRGG